MDSGFFPVFGMFEVSTEAHDSTVLILCMYLIDLINYCLNQVLEMYDEMQQHLKPV